MSDPNAAPRVVTRFPPSPTGDLHLGGARTALFNWLYARHHGGRFVFRLEDTDLQRSKPEHVTSIVEAMEWLGLDHDDGPYYQSQRFERYRQVIDELLARGQAYWCHCSPEAIQAQRDAAMARGDKPMYDGTCREKNLGPAPGAVVRFKGPRTGSTVLNDLVKGPIEFQHSELDDLIILRSDGAPTYHLAVIADDLDMGITHVIRGDDHVNNTPRQMLLIQALGHNPPHYAHVPMILGQDKAKLSKRHGATSVVEYQKMGYLPEAMVNALARLGWSHGDQEIFGIAELIQLFDLDHVGRSAAVFDTDRLVHLNQHYIQAADDSRLARLTLPFLAQLGVENPDLTVLTRAIPHLKPRAKTLVEMADWAQPYLVAEPALDPKGRKQFLGAKNLPALEAMRALVAGGDLADLPALEEKMRTTSEGLGLKMKDLAQPARVALTGRTFSPGVFEVVVILGRETALERLDRGIALAKAVAA